MGNETLVPFSVGDLRDFASQTRTLETVAGSQYDGAWPATMRDGDRVLSPNTAVVSGNYFSTLGVRPAVGRILTERDDVAGGDAIAISYSLWRRAFGAELPRVDDIRIDVAVLAAAATIVIASTLAFSLWPAIALSRQRDLHNALRSSARTGGTSVASRRGRSVLVVAQVALAIVVLVGAGLLGRTLSTLQNLDMGFASDELSTAQLYGVSPSDPVTMAAAALKAE